MVMQLLQFFPVPWTNFLVGGGVRLGRGAMLDALRASLARLGVEQLDLWQVIVPLTHTLACQQLCLGTEQKSNLGNLPTVCSFRSLQSNASGIILIVVVWLSQADVERYLSAKQD